MPRLLAVCVGLPQDVSWRGKTVRTAVWKRAVDGPRMVRRVNIDGDGQGDLMGHGGEQRAVLVYQIDSYRYWHDFLGRDDDFVYGQFGENFTVDGLADDEVCVGDRYRIGDAVFEVTQPRVTCYRVGVRMDEPRMPSLMVSHRRPGFYMRVLREGHVEAGDEIVKVATGPELMTVAEVDALLYLPGHSRGGLERALRIPALSPGWQGSFHQMIDRLDAPDGDGDGDEPGELAGNVGLNQAATSPPPAWSGFRPLRVARREDETPTVASFWLAPTSDDDTELPPPLAGQFVTLRLRPDAGGRAVIRSYSLSSPPGSTRYRISVKREPGGVASGYLHDRVRVGDTIEVAAPRGTFILRTGDTPVVLLSAGIGVTPVLAMLHALAAEHAQREMWWLHGARNRNEHAFAREARSLLDDLPNARAHICYSRPGPGDSSTETGRLTAESIVRLGVPRVADAYVCGPTAFMDQLVPALVDLGFAPPCIHTETFGATGAITPGITVASTGPPHPPAGPPGNGPAVSFARSDLTVDWSPDYASVLELAEACDVPTRWSCRTGVCHTCETALLSGSLAYSPEPVDPPAAGNVLICCARPEGEIVLDL